MNSKFGLAVALLNGLVTINRDPRRTHRIATTTVTSLLNLQRLRANVIYQVEKGTAKLPLRRLKQVLPYIQLDLTVIG